MKLAAIYNVWSDSSDLLKGSIERIIDSVDLVVIVYQTVSNFGQVDNTCLFDLKEIEGDKIIKIFYSPIEAWKPQANEINKRKQGVMIANQHGCSHFLLMDCDEYYDPTEFKTAKEWVIERNFIATYVDMWTYFLKPYLRLREPTKATFICSMDSLPLGGSFGGINADYTRKVTATHPQLAPIMMHHVSWIRKDIWCKLNNSSAINIINKKRSVIQYDLDNAERLMHSKFYNTTLERCEPILPMLTA
jgi:hypothetical protein